MSDLSNFRVAILTTDGFDEPEFVRMHHELSTAGAYVIVLSPKHSDIQGVDHQRKQDKILASRNLENAQASDYEALVIPGGKQNAELLASDSRALALVRDIHSSGKPIATIGHGLEVLLKAGLIRGQTVKGALDLESEVRAAGGEWAKDPVVIHSHWITCEGKDHLDVFCREAIGLFSRTTPSVIQVAESA